MKMREKWNEVEFKEIKTKKKTEEEKTTILYKVYINPFLIF